MAFESIGSVTFTVNVTPPLCAGDSATFKITNIVRTPGPNPQGPIVFTWAINSTPGVIIATGDSVELPAGPRYIVKGIDPSDLFPQAQAGTQQPTAVAPAIITPTLFQDSVDCFGGNDGTAFANPNNGGTSPYTFNWSNATGTIVDNDAGAGTDLTINLPAGKYIVTITDNVGCSIKDSVEILQPDPILIPVTIDTADCFGGTAAVTANPSGGNGNGTFTQVEWSSTGITNNLIQVGLTVAVPGPNYSVTVTDSKGCTGSSSFTLTEPDPILVTVAPDTIPCLVLRE